MVWVKRPPRNAQWQACVILPAILAAVTLAGCGTSSVFPPRPLLPLASALPVERVWTRVNRLDDAPGQILLPLSHVHGRLYWTDSGNVLHAVDSHSGRNVWRYRSDLPLISGVGGDDSLLLVGSRDGDVLALDPAQGTLRWRSRVSSEVLAPPQHGSGTVIAYAVDGKVFALDAQTGKIRWQFDTQVPLLTLRGLATPRIVDDRVLVGLANGRVLALQLADGKNLWSTEVAPARGRSEIERLVDVDAAPLVLGDVAYCVAFQGQVTAISIATGRVLWARELSSTADMAYDDEALYVTSPDGSLTALTRSAGEILWRQDALQYRYVTGPARLGEYLIVGDIEGYMHWLDRHTGNIVHRKRLDDAPIGSEPIVAGSQVFFLSRGGILDAWTLPNSPVTPSAVPGAAS